MYPYTQWLMIIIPTKWLFHWGYTPFSDKPICFNQKVEAASWNSSSLPGSFLFQTADIRPDCPTELLRDRASHERKGPQMTGSAQWDDHWFFFGKWAVDHYQLIQLVISHDYDGWCWDHNFCYESIITDLVCSQQLQTFIPVLNSSPASRLEIFTCNGWWALVS